MRKITMTILFVLLAFNVFSQNWVHEITRDAMTDSVIHVLITAEQGGEDDIRAAYLGVRIEGQMVQILLLTNRVSPESEVLIRLDQGTPEYVEMIDVGGDGMLMHPDSDEFIKTLVSHDELVIRFWDYSDTQFTPVFNLVGLREKLEGIAW